MQRTLPAASIIYAFALQQSRLDIKQPRVTLMKQRLWENCRLCTGPVQAFRAARSWLKIVWTSPTMIISGDNGIDFRGTPDIGGRRTPASYGSQAATIAQSARLRWLGALLVDALGILHTLRKELSKSLDTAGYCIRLCIVREAPRCYAGDR